MLTNQEDEVFKDLISNTCRDIVHYKLDPLGDEPLS